MLNVIQVKFQKQAKTFSIKVRTTNQESKWSKCMRNECVKEIKRKWHVSIRRKVSTSRITITKKSKTNAITRINESANKLNEWKSLGYFFADWNEKKNKNEWQHRPIATEEQKMALFNKFFQSSKRKNNLQGESTKRQQLPSNQPSNERWAKRPKKKFKFLRTLCPSKDYKHFHYRTHCRRGVIC